MAEVMINRHAFFTRSGHYHNIGTDRKDERVQLPPAPVLSL